MLLIYIGVFAYLSYIARGREYVEGITRVLCWAARGRLEGKGRWNECLKGILLWQS